MSTLERSMQIRLTIPRVPGATDTYHFVVLAMVAQKMGDEGRAGDYLRQTREGVENFAPARQDPILARLLREAEALIDPRARELPDDVFAPAAEPAAPSPHDR